LTLPLKIGKVNKMAVKEKTKTFESRELLAFFIGLDKEAKTKLKNTLKYKASFYEFFKASHEVLEPETILEDNWHIKYLCDLLQAETHRIGKKEPKTQDLIINIPPRSFKSRIVSVAWNAWSWTIYPHLKFLTSSYSKEFAIRDSVQTRSLIMSEWYQDLFGDVFELSSDQNVKSNFANNKGGTRFATSVGGSATGGGGDIVIVDDPINSEQAYSDAERETANRWWTQTMYSRLNDQKIGLRVVVMQRLHEKDLTGELLEKKANYKHICIPAEVGNNISPKELVQNYVDGLFSLKRFTKEVLRNYKTGLGSYGYAGQMLQNPAPSEGGMLKRNWFKIVKQSELPTDLNRNFYSDTDYGKEGSDNSATGIASNWNGKLIVWRVKTVNKTFPEFKKYHKTFILENGYSVKSRDYFEPKATGISIVQDLKADYFYLTPRQNIIESLADVKPEIQSQCQKIAINVKEDKAPTDSKQTRIGAVSAFIESGNVLLVEGSWNDEFIEECCIFPNGKHDDQVDVLEMMIRNEMFSSTFKGTNHKIINQVL
jgi:phage terminase large subunit-like protein